MWWWGVVSNRWQTHKWVYLRMKKWSHTVQDMDENVKRIWGHTSRRCYCRQKHSCISMETWLCTCERKPWEKVQTQFLHSSSRGHVWKRLKTVLSHGTRGQCVTKCKRLSVESSLVSFHSCSDGFRHINVAWAALHSLQLWRQLNSFTSPAAWCVILWAGGSFWLIVSPLVCAFLTKQGFETRHTSLGFLYVKDCAVCDPLLPVSHVEWTARFLTRQQVVQLHSDSTTLKVVLCELGLNCQM